MHIPLSNFAFLPYNHIALLKNRFLEKILLKSAKTGRFFTKFKSNFFTLIEKQFQVIERAKFEFKVTVHYGIWEKHPVVTPKIFCKHLSLNYMSFVFLLCL